MKHALKISAMAFVTAIFGLTNVTKSLAAPADSLGYYADVNGNLTTGTLTLTPDKVWYLDKKIYVPEGDTIIIQPGTVIKAKVGAGLSSPALIVVRGAKIYALGTAENPIIFTSVEDPLDGTYSVNTRGKWGGVILLGRAYNNLTEATVAGILDGEGTIEGLAVPDDRHHYGQDRWEARDTIGHPERVIGQLKPGGDFDANDNSGIMTYVSIRHGGALIGDANEINGLTCGSVGRGTKLEHIEIIANEDDGIEFFGGNVDLKYATVAYCNDDYIDWDQGYSGKGQFILGIQLPASTSPVYPLQGDNGLEIDGDDDNYFNNISLPSGVSLGNPVFYNVTMIGNNADEGIEAKERVEGTINNSIFANFRSGVHLNAESGRPVDGYHNWQSGKLVLRNNTIARATASQQFLRVGGVKASSADSTTFAGQGNLAKNDVVDFTLVINANTNFVSNACNPVPNSLSDVSTNLLPPNDGFFTPVNYRGAFAPGQTPWTSGWTLSEDIPWDGGVAGCAGDLSGPVGSPDGLVDTNDFLKLISKWGPCVSFSKK